MLRGLYLIFTSPIKLCLGLQLCAAIYYVHVFKCFGVKPSYKQRVEQKKKSYNESDGEKSTSVTEDKSINEH